MVILPGMPDVVVVGGELPRFFAQADNVGRAVHRPESTVEMPLPSTEGPWGFSRLSSAPLGLWELRSTRMRDSRSAFRLPGSALWRPTTGLGVTSGQGHSHCTDVGLSFSTDRPR